MLDKLQRESIYQPEQPGLIFPERPVFDTHAQARRHRQVRLVAARRAFALQGLDDGLAGHKVAAAFWFIAWERRCQQQSMIDASGHAPQLVPPDKAHYSCEHVGSEYIGWPHLQPIWEQLLKAQPDMLE